MVHEQNGHVDGTLCGAIQACRPAAPDDPLVRFDFAGDFGATAESAIPAGDQRRNARAPIELIPGPAFNLLEVNFQTDPQAEQDPRRAISFW